MDLTQGRFAPPGSRTKATSGGAKTPVKFRSLEGKTAREELESQFQQMAKFTPFVAIWTHLIGIRHRTAFKCFSDGIFDGFDLKGLNFFFKSTH